MADEQITLNVGGKIFQCLKSTLVTYPDTLLARMFTSSASMAKKGSDGAYFFDRDSEIFAAILNFYRTGKMIVAKNTPIKRVKEELDYFGIDLDEDDIYEENEGDEKDPITTYLSVIDLLKKIPREATHIGNLVVFNLSDDEDEDPEDETTKMENAMNALVTKESVHRFRNELPNVETFFEMGTAVEKHTHSDSEGEEKEQKEEKEEEEEEPATSWTTEEYNAMVDICENLDKIRQSSTFCCGGWFEFLKNAMPNLLIGPSVEKGKEKIPEVAWFWAGDQKGKSTKGDTKIPYVDDVARKIEAAYQGGEKIYNLDKERYIDFKRMEQIRFDDSSRRRKVFRGDSKKDTKKPEKKKVKVDDDKNCGKLTDLDLDAISSECTVAPFGDLKDMKTKVDPNVRVALELDAARVHFKPELLHVWLQITTYLIGNFVNEPISFIPYKLNMYGKGGFFKPHVDTPVSPDKMIGTLLLVLPVAHKGGALVVKHGSASHTFEFAETASTTSKLQWAAFFSDCEHEVKLVEDGTRITIAYQIVTEQKEDFQWGGDNHQYKYYLCAPGPSLPAKDEYFAKIYNDIKDLANFRTIGLCFAHRYTVRGLSPENLKGKDKQLYEYFNGKNDLKVRILPVVIHVSVETQIDDGSYSDKQVSKAVYALSKEDMLHFRGKGPKPTYPFSKVPFLVATVRGQLLTKHTYPGSEGGLTGNYSPATADALYMYGAMLVTKK